jgi:hypothetical protein
MSEKAEETKMKYTQKMWAASFLCALALFVIPEAQAQVPDSGTDCNGTYSGTFVGNLTVSAGQTCIFTSGGVTGDVQETGGDVEFSNSTVTGNVQQGGGTLLLASTTVTENVQITGAPTFSLESATINGNLEIQRSTSAPPSQRPPCAVHHGGHGSQVCNTTVRGDLQSQSNANPVDIVGSSIGGSLQVQSNSAAADMESNGVTGDIEVSDNSADTFVSGNTANGNLQDQGNTGPDAADVESNTITKNLQCQNNTPGTTNNNNTVGGITQCN